MHGNTSIYRLLGATTELLKEVAPTCILPHHKSLATSFADDFDAEAIRPPRPNFNKSTEVRGLRYAPALLDSGDGNIEKLFAAVRAAFTFARWTEFYEETPWSQPFLSRFATGECIGPTGRFQSDDVVLGLFVLGPKHSIPPMRMLRKSFTLSLPAKRLFKQARHPHSLRKNRATWSFMRVSSATQSEPLPSQCLQCTDGVASSMDQAGFVRTWPTKLNQRNFRLACELSRVRHRSYPCGEDRLP